MPHLPPTHESVWLNAPLLRTSQVPNDTHCDVCIVGAGIAGLLTAERLSAAGRSVVILDAGPVAGGETSRTTAHFVTALDDRYTSLQRMHGARGARLAAESHAAAIGHVEDLCARLRIDCGWQRLDGYLAVNSAHRARCDELLSEELEAATACGLSIERVSSLPGPWPASLGPALRFPSQAQLHPLQLLRGLAHHLMQSGVRIYTGTRASNITGGPDAAVTTVNGPIVRCSHVVVATNTPVNNLVAVHTKQSGYQTYVLAFRIPFGALPPLLLWDGLWENDAAYHYLRLYGGDGGVAAIPGADDDLLIVGGEDHKTGQGPDGDGPYHRLEQWTREHFPMCGAIAHRWSGEVMEPADGLAFIGHNALGHQNVYIVTGDSGNGMTHGAIAALIIPDLIMGHDHPWSTLYDPARKIGMHALGHFTRENLNTLAQYRDWLKDGDADSEDQIEPGQGAIVRRGLKHLAIYKDEQGACTHLNAACPHLGGVVRWNDAEKTWDCPCHASRFDRTGKVIHGPANTNLKPEHIPQTIEVGPETAMRAK